MTFSDADAQRLLRIVEEKVDRAVSRMPYTTYGIVDTVNATTRKANVFLNADTTSSAGFDYGRIEPQVGELVRVVIDPRGDRYIESILRAGAVHVSPENEVDEGGQVTLLGAGANSNINLDNLTGRFRVHSDGKVYLDINRTSAMVLGPSDSSMGSGVRIWPGKLALGTSGVAANSIGMLFGADVELFKSAANVLALETGDRFDSEAVGYAVRKTSSQSLGTSGTGAQITGWTTTDWAGLGATWNANGQNEIELETTGVYLVWLHATFAANATGRRVLGLMYGLNEAPNAPGGGENFLSAMAAPTGDTNLHMVRITKLQAGARIGLWALQQSGGALNVTLAGLGAVRVGTD